MWIETYSINARGVLVSSHASLLVNISVDVNIILFVRFQLKRWGSDFSWFLLVSSTTLIPQHPRYFPTSMCSSDERCTWERVSRVKPYGWLTSLLFAISHLSGTTSSTLSPSLVQLPPPACSTRKDMGEHSYTNLNFPFLCLTSPGLPNIPPYSRVL